MAMCLRKKEKIKTGLFLSQDKMFKKMLKNRPEDALAKLVKTVENVKTVEIVKTVETAETV